jgi:predicted CoA-substrate-specific enzyme activase
MKAVLGIDVGAVSTNLALLDGDLTVIDHHYVRTQGAPVSSIQDIMKRAASRGEELDIVACGSTGSGRHLAAALVGCDVVKNEITAHATGTLHFFPETRTIIEIGGQDSKVIVVRDGSVVDFAMNTLCAAGTGSFLDYQAGRMGISIEEFADLARSSQHSARISGRCGVFADTDIAAKQQQGVGREAIARGLCDCLAKNFLSCVAGGKEIGPPVIFQGGVASNVAVKEAFERELGNEVKVPEFHKVMGAIGVAILAWRGARQTGPSQFRGFAIRDGNLSTSSFECTECSNSCDILEILEHDVLISRWGSRCGRWNLKE